jgi:hypothetical protein
LSDYSSSSDDDSISLFGESYDGSMDLDSDESDGDGDGMDISYG